MRQMAVSTSLAFGMTLMALTQDVQAYSSYATRTRSDIFGLSIALTAYQMEFGRFPPSDRYWEELERAKMWHPPPRSPGQPLDAWGHPLIYRLPGKHGPFDLYSFGMNGIDEDGGHDDISNWAEVQDGFYWKSTWPLGRWTLAGAGLFWVIFFLLRRLPRWRAIALLFACIGSICTGLGLIWVAYPWDIPCQNLPLNLGILAAFSGAAVFMGLFSKHLIKGSLTTASSEPSQSSGRSR